MKRLILASVAVFALLLVSSADAHGVAVGVGRVNVGVGRVFAPRVAVVRQPVFVQPRVVVQRQFVQPRVFVQPSYGFSNGFQSFGGYGVQSNFGFAPTYGVSTFGAGGCGAFLSY